MLRNFERNLTSWGYLLKIRFTRGIFTEVATALQIYLEESMKEPKFDSWVRFETFKFSRCLWNCRIFLSFLSWSEFFILPGLRDRRDSAYEPFLKVYLLSDFNSTLRSEPLIWLEVRLNNKIVLLETILWNMCPILNSYAIMILGYCLLAWNSAYLKISIASNSWILFLPMADKNQLPSSNSTTFFYSSIKFFSAKYPSFSHFKLNPTKIRF